MYVCMYVQAGTKCMRDRNRERVMHAIALTVHDQSCTLFQFKKQSYFVLTH